MATAAAAAVDVDQAGAVRLGLASNLQLLELVAGAQRIPAPYFVDLVVTAAAVDVDQAGAARLGLASDLQLLELVAGA